MLRPSHLRDRIRAHGTARLVYRSVIGVVGALVIVVGALLLPLPGPGWLVIFLGLGLLASEFPWAEQALHHVRRRVRAWSGWVQRQALVVRVLLALGGLALVIGVVWAYDAWVGLPAWVPVLGEGAAGAATR